MNQIAKLAEISGARDSPEVRDFSFRQLIDDTNAYLGVKQKRNIIGRIPTLLEVSSYFLLHPEERYDLSFLREVRRPRRVTIFYGKGQKKKMKEAAGLLKTAGFGVNIVEDGESRENIQTCSFFQNPLELYLGIQGTKKFIRAYS